MMVKADDFAKSVADAMGAYSQKVIIGVKGATDDVTTQTVKAIKENVTKAGIRRRRGAYKRGFEAITLYENDLIKINTIHNATGWQLTHLLENGHATKNGKTTKAYPHIAPTAETAVRNLERSIRKAVGNI